MSEPKTEIANRVKPIEVALADPALTRIYANGFGLGFTNADAYIVLQAFGKPVAVVNLSYTLAKTLAQKLSAMVADWERNTGQTLQTTEMIEQAFSKDKE